MTTSPEICGFYSTTVDGQYEDSISSLRYFVMPKLPIDLNIGLQNFKDKSDEYFGNETTRILTFLVRHKSEFLKNVESTQIEEKLIPSVRYITSAAVLRRIYCSALDPWYCIVTKYKGNIYLSKYLPKEDIEQHTRYKVFNTFRQYGEIFEHHCLSEHPNKTPDTSQAWNSNTQFFCVLKRNLVDRQFLIAAEMDGTDSETPLNPSNPREWKTSQFIKLKLNCGLTTRRRRDTFENVKVGKIWAEAQLSGIDKIHIGFRTDQGITEKIRCFSVIELERIRNRSWSGSLTAAGFLNNFLDDVERDFKDIDCPYTTIKYHYDSAFRNLSSTKHDGETEYSFLPEWYLMEMK